MEAEVSKKPSRQDLWVAIGLSLAAALAFYFSTKPTLKDLDYTLEIASAFLGGDLGLREKPPEWLNEMIPYGNRYYSAFPLGAVLSMVPVALLQKASVIHTFPARILAALIAGACVYFFFQLAQAFGPDYSSLQTEAADSADFIGVVPNIWNLDMVQPWDGRCLANRSRSRAISRNRSAVFYVGAALAAHCRGLFRTCSWKPDRTAPHSTFLPLSFVAPLKRKRCRSVAHRSNQTSASRERTDGYRFLNSAGSVGTAYRDI